MQFLIAGKKIQLVPKVVCPHEKADSNLERHLQQGSLVTRSNSALKVMRYIKG
jgi:hypothetical protein